MIIRNAQMQVFSDYMFAAFVRRMIVHLRLTCPEETQHLDDGALSELIRKGVENASTFNIQEEQNLETFLEYTARYGVEFYDTPKFRGARQVLENDQINETEKMNRVNEYLIFGKDAKL